MPHPGREVACCVASSPACAAASRGARPPSPRGEGRHVALSHSQCRALFPQRVAGAALPSRGRAAAAVVRALRPPKPFAASAPWRRARRAPRTVSVLSFSTISSVAADAHTSERRADSDTGRAGCARCGGGARRRPGRGRATGARGHTGGGAMRQQAAHGAGGQRARARRPHRDVGRTTCPSVTPSRAAPRARGAHRQCGRVSTRPGKRAPAAGRAAPPHARATYRAARRGGLGGQRHAGGHASDGHPEQQRVQRAVWHWLAWPRHCPGQLRPRCQQSEWLGLTRPIFWPRETQRIY